MIELVDSVVTVRRTPGHEETITYRLGVTGAPPITGTDVPASDLARHFSRATREAVGLEKLARLGLTLVGPTTFSPDGHGAVLHAPFVQVDFAGSAFRLATVAFASDDS